MGFHAGIKFGSNRGVYSITNDTASNRSVWVSRDGSGERLGQLQSFVTNSGQRKWRIYNASAHTGTGGDGFGSDNNGLARANNNDDRCPEDAALEWVSMQGSYSDPTMDPNENWEEWPITVACYNVKTAAADRAANAAVDTPASNGLEGTERALAIGSIGAATGFLSGVFVRRQRGSLSSSSW